MTPATRLDTLLRLEMRNAGVRAPLPAVRAVYTRGLTASGSDEVAALQRVARFLSAVREGDTSHEDADLIPAQLPETSLQRAVRLSYDAHAPAVTDLLLASAVTPPDAPAYLFNLSRALWRANKVSDPVTRFALTAALRALVADGNSSIARSLRARRQLRDRKGRWIEMGGGVRFKVRTPGAPGGGHWFHGRVEGIDVPNGRVDVRLEDGRLVEVPNDKLEQPKAILNLPGQPPIAQTDPGELDPNAPMVDEAPEVQRARRVVAERAPSIDEVATGVKDANRGFRARIPDNSTEASTADRVISAVSQAMHGSDLGRLDVRDYLSNAATFAEERARRTDGEEGAAWEAYAEDLQDLAAAVAPDNPRDVVARIRTPEPESAPAAPEAPQGNRAPVPAGLQHAENEIHAFADAIERVPEGGLTPVQRAQRAARAEPDVFAALRDKMRQHDLDNTGLVRNPNNRAWVRAQDQINRNADAKANNAGIMQVFARRQQAPATPAPAPAEPDAPAEAPVPQVPDVADAIPQLEEFNQLQQSLNDVAGQVQRADVRDPIKQMANVAGNVGRELHNGDLPPDEAADLLDRLDKNIDALRERAGVADMLQRNPQLDGALNDVQNDLTGIRERLRNPGPRPEAEAPAEEAPAEFDPWAQPAQPVEVDLEAGKERALDAIHAEQDAFADAPGQADTTEFHDAIERLEAAVVNDLPPDEINRALENYIGIAAQIHPDAEDPGAEVAEAVAGYIYDLQHNNAPESESPEPDPESDPESDFPTSTPLSSPGEIDDLISSLPESLAEAFRDVLDDPPEGNREDALSGLAQSADLIANAPDVDPDMAALVRNLGDALRRAAEDDAPAPAPEQPEDTPTPEPPETPQDNPDVRDQFGGDVPVGFDFERVQRFHNAGEVQIYSHRDDDGRNFTVEVGGVDPTYIIRDEDGAFIDAGESWDDVTAHFLNQRQLREESAAGRAAAAQRRADLQDLQRRRVDEGERPLPEGWQMEIINNGLDAVYHNEAHPRYSVVIDEDQDIVLLRREADGRMAQVGAVNHDWDALEAQIQEDGPRRAQETREALATFLTENGFGPNVRDAARVMRSADELRRMIERDNIARRWEADPIPNLQKREQLRRLLGDLQDIQGAPEDSQANPNQRARREIGERILERVPGVDPAVIDDALSLDDPAAILARLREDQAWREYAQRMDVRRVDDPERAEGFRPIVDAIWDLPNIEGANAPETPGNGDDAPEAPAAPEVPAAPEAPVAAEPAPGRQGVPRAPGAPPDRRRFHDPRGVILDRNGTELYRGLRVRALLDGRVGTVVRVQEDPGYAEVRWDDGRVQGRSGRRLVVLPTDRAGAPAAPAAPAPAAPAAPAAPDAPAAPAAPAAPRVLPGGAEQALNEILQMHAAGANNGWALHPEVGAARNLLTRALARLDDPDWARQQVGYAVAHYDAALADHRGFNEDNRNRAYWDDVQRRRDAARALFDSPLAFQDPGAAEAFDPEPQIEAIRDLIRGIEQRQRAAGGVQRWRARFGLERDVIPAIEAGNYEEAVRALRVAENRLAAEGRPGEHDTIVRIREAVEAGAAGRGGQGPGIPRGEGFMPGDFVENRNRGDQAIIGGTGDTPGVVDPAPGRDPLPGRESANPLATQRDFAEWGTRAGEIARAARNRPSITALAGAARDGARFNQLLSEVFGNDGAGFKFGSKNYSLTVTGASGNEGFVTANFNIVDERGRSIGAVSRNFTLTAGKWIAYNSSMKINNPDNRKNGFASAFNRHMENWYIANGFSEVQVSAAGGGGYTGGFVWAMNGFGWRGDRKGQAARALQRVVADTPQARTQLEYLRRRNNAGDVPTPMEIALIGWNPSLGNDQTWAGKVAMSGYSWAGVKKLKARDTNAVQARNYSLARQARERVARGDNVAEVSPEFVHALSNGSVTGASDAGLSDAEVVAVGRVLEQRQSLAAVPFLQKQKMFQWVNDRLRAGDSVGSGDGSDLFALRGALQRELQADYLEPSDLGVGEPLRRVSFDDVARNQVPGFTVAQPDNGGGINDTYKVTHNESGQVFFFKRERFGSRDNEHDVVHMLRNAGWRGYGAYAIHETDDKIVIQQRAGDALDFPKRPNDARRVPAHADASNKFANYEDPLRMAVLDALIFNTDRHSGNFQVAKDGQGRWWLFPIDHGLAMIGKDREPPDPSSWFQRGLHINNVYTNLKTLLGRRGQDEVLLKSDLLRIINEYRTGLQASGYANDRFVRQMLQRVDQLESNVDRVVRSIRGR